MYTTDTFNIDQQGTACCNYGKAGVGVMGYDCVIIPGAAKKTANTILPNQAFCGAFLVTIHTGAAGKTVCSKSFFRHCQKYAQLSKKFD